MHSCGAANELRPDLISLPAVQVGGSCGTSAAGGGENHERCKQFALYLHVTYWSPFLMYRTALLAWSGMGLLTQGLHVC